MGVGNRRIPMTPITAVFKVNQGPIFLISRGRLLTLFQPTKAGAADTVGEITCAVAEGSSSVGSITVGFTGASVGSGVSAGSGGAAVGSMTRGIDSGWPAQLFTSRPTTNRIIAEANFNFTGIIVTFICC